MASNGYLVPPSKNPEREELWNETWKRIDRFLPGLRADLALDVPEEVVPAARGEQQAVQPQGEEGKVEGAAA